MASKAEQGSDVEPDVNFSYVWTWQNMWHDFNAECIEGVVSEYNKQHRINILPVATLSIALYVPRKYRPSSDVAPEVCILLSAI